MGVTFGASHVELVFLIFLDILDPGAPGQSGGGVDEAVEEFVVFLLDELVLVEPVDAGHGPEILGDLGELFFLAALYP